MSDNFQNIFTTNNPPSGASRLAEHKFGYNPSLATGQWETVWDGSNIYTYASTPGPATVTSSDSDDNGGTVQVFGLDENYDTVSEIITIGGSAGTQTFSRVYRARMVSANTGDVNVGDISVTVDSVQVAKIRIGYGQTLMTVFTTPRNYRGFLVQIDLGSQKDAEHEVRFITREIDNGNTWNTRTLITLRGGFMEKSFSAPILILPKTDMEIQAYASNTSALSASFEMYLQRV